MFRVVLPDGSDLFIRARSAASARRKAWWSLDPQQQRASEWSLPLCTWPCEIVPDSPSVTFTSISQSMTLPPLAESVQALDGYLTPAEGSDLLERLLEGAPPDEVEAHVLFHLHRVKCYLGGGGTASTQEIESSFWALIAQLLRDELTADQLCDAEFDSDSLDKLHEAGLFKDPS